jgi:hypothetical protein
LEKGKLKTTLKITVALFCMSALLCLVNSVSAAGSINIVQNGDFKTGNFDGWTLEGAGLGILSSHDFPPTVSTSGHGSSSAVFSKWYMDQDSGVNGYFSYVLAQKLPNLPTSDVTSVSCWMRGAGGSLTINYTDGTSDRSSFVENGPNGDWVQYTVLLTEGKVVDSIVIRGDGCHGFGTGVSDVRVTEILPSQTRTLENSVGLIGALATVSIALVVVAVNKKNARKLTVQP